MQNTRAVLQQIGSQTTNDDCFARAGRTNASEGPDASDSDVKSWSPADQVEDTKIAAPDDVLESFATSENMWVFEPLAMLMNVR